MANNMLESDHPENAELPREGQSAEICRGAMGESAQPRTIIDLRKPCDLNLVYRSVVNGWDVPQETRNQICDQFDVAMDYYYGDEDPRSTARFIKLVKMLLLMDKRNLIDLHGVPKSKFPELRKRYPDQRQCRRSGRTHEKQEAELARLLAELAGGRKSA